MVFNIFQTFCGNFILDSALLITVNQMNPFEHQNVDYLFVSEIPKNYRDHNIMKPLFTDLILLSDLNGKINK